MTVSRKDNGFNYPLLKLFVCTSMWIVLVLPTVAIATDPGQQLFDAIDQGNIAGVKRALLDQADLNVVRIKPRGLGHETPLSHAVDLAEPEIVEILLQQGADPELPSAVFNCRPLSNAILKGDAEMVALLLKYDADVNPEGGFLRGHSPLYLATSSGNLTIVKILLAAGAKIIPGRWSYFKEILASPWNLLTGHVVDLGSPPSLLDAAKKSGNDELYQLLKKHGAR